MEVKLSPAQRQILANQYDILERLDPDGANDYKRFREILTRGFSVLYDDVVSVWEEMDVQDGQYVIAVLNMHRDLKRSFEALKDKAGLDASDVEYRGFDGNNEGMRLALAEFLGKEGRWQELNLQKDSHSQSTIRRYPAMLERWREIVHSNNGNPLTVDQIKYVVDWQIAE